MPGERARRRGNAGAAGAARGGRLRGSGAPPAGRRADGGGEPVTCPARPGRRPRRQPGRNLRAIPHAYRESFNNYFPCPKRPAGTSHHLQRRYHGTISVTLRPRHLRR